MSQPNLDERPSDRIHPALDFTTDHAYVGQELAVMGRSNHAEKHLCLIRDDRTIVVCDRDSLEQSELELAHSDFCFEQRWSAGNIAKFRRGETTATERTQLLKKIKEEFKLYIEFQDERLYDFFALWNIGTYFFPLFNAYPYVYVGGISQSGKTKLLTLCSCICFNSIPSANMTTATIYRLIQMARCSLFIDETEQLSSRDRASDFRNILLNGYKKGLRTYRNIRTEDGNYTPGSFEVYGPKMLANINGLEDVLESRCITIIMRRGSNRDLTNREVDVNNPKWQQTRDMIYPFLMENWREIRQTYTEFENDTTLRNRDWELWKPILSLAKCFDSTDLLEEMRTLALEKTEASQRDDRDTHEFVLVEVLLHLVEEDGFYRLRAIKNAMADLSENSGWLNERYVGRLLRRLGFSNSRRLGSGTEYFLEVSDVRSLAQRLGIGEGSEGSEGAGESATEPGSQEERST